MAMTKSEVRRAFRAAMAADYAHVPAADDVKHTFSSAFLEKMAALLTKERRGSWQLLSRQRRRALAVAAILAAALLLTACSPTLREAVAELLVTFQERFVDYGATASPHEKIETIYVFDPVPEGFEFVSQTQHSPYFVETVYQDEQGIKMQLSQATSQNMTGIADNEQGEIIVVETDNTTLFFTYSTETLTVVSWIFDGYCMELFYFGQIDHSQIVALTSSLSPLE